MWYIVLIDAYGDNHKAVQVDESADQDDYTEMVGMQVAGKFSANSPDDAIRAALKSDPSTWEGCVA